MNTKTSIPDCIKDYTTPSDVAFLRLYFVNLVSGYKFNTFHHAVITGNRSAQIAEKMTGAELKYLIEHIEALQ